MTALKIGRFAISEFLNPSQKKVFRVAGYKRDGSRVRENFPEFKEAQIRQLELETEYLMGEAETSIQATKLSGDQVRIAELAIARLGEDWQRLLDCVECWQRSGGNAIKLDAPFVDDAIGDAVAPAPGCYLHWLKESPLRDATKKHWKTRISVFKNSVPNVRVSQMTPEFVEKFLSDLKVMPEGKDTYRRAISRFCSWCIERPRRWMASNPCREVRIERGEKAPPAVLSVKECRKGLRAARKEGLTKYFALCLFGKLRPFETRRLKASAINLKDGEIRLEAADTKTGRKTGRGRIVWIDETLAAWLKAAGDEEIFPRNWRKRFDRVKLKMGYGVGLKAWPDDVLRHTGISHYFRLTGSYGKTAEESGTSEAIIKKHYQGRVSSDETKKFYGLRP